MSAKRLKEIEIFEHKTKSSGLALVTFPKNSLPDRVCQIYRNVVRAKFKKSLAEGESTSVKEALRPEEYLFVSKYDRQLKKLDPAIDALVRILTSEYTKYTQENLKTLTPGAFRTTWANLAEELPEEKI
jgi:hypothetical protein